MFHQLTLVEGNPTTSPLYGREGIAQSLCTRVNARFDRKAVESTEQSRQELMAPWR